ncbi:S-adenosyl-L-methionine-dependent methyltransferase [Vigna unguiculata]|uniref:S-adenosyl-L-methionine-dependent methyltransferase n=1 Tax=Vigna unguiculata TaxID=3917 RepID=A0A4D6LHI3_VIGUN|nr:S-adenosyl-L-methionine-dependent methyltransferase [Vigna unguiculata]
MNMETVLSNHSPPLEFKGLSKEEEDSLLGQVEIWRYMTSFTDSMALKAVVELRIADIIDSYGKPLSLSQIVENIENAPSPDASLLERVMRVMVRRKIFSAEKSETGETLYGMTRASKWILRDTKITIAPFLLLENHPIHLNPAHYISEIGNEAFTDVGIAFDMMLLAHNAGGKERTEENWKWLFKETGFARYNIIKINALPSIIEAYPI